MAYYFPVLCCFLFTTAISLTESYKQHQSLKKIQTRTSAETQAQAVQSLISRLIPGRAAEFVVEIIPSDLPTEENGYFEIYKKPDQVVHVIGSTGVMAAWGFHYYLTKYCACHVSWDYDNLNLPEILPNVSIRISSIDQFRYHQNVCTVSYSYAWWQWPRWERDIDWMALQGINLPLAFTGQELIWQRVYLSFGVTRQDLDEHFSGPAFFAWQRMGNIRGWGGPLSDHWQQSTHILAHRILDRMRSFGMIPVLPAFAGHVPRALERIFPNASFTHLTPWLNFPDEYCCPLFLKPTEPLFTEIGAKFIEEMTAEFGTDHVYNCDVFNEVRPTQPDPVFVSSVGQAVFNAMTVSDPDAIWMMQGWLFKNDYDFWTADLAKALLTSVPSGRMLILDLQAESDPQYIRLESFYGQPFIFCLLHNFGGTLGFFGTIPLLAQRVIDARRFPNSSMVGTGLSMEGIDQNYVVYDFMLEMGLRSQPPNLNKWFDNYTIRRYGYNNSAVQLAWHFLQRSVYNATQDLFYRGRYIVLSRRPNLVFKPSPMVWYDPHDVILAWNSFILAATDYPLSGSANFQHDLIDVTRQAMQEMFHLFYSQLVASYLEKNTTSFRDSGRKMIDLLQDLDELLQSGSKFLLGKWIADARSWGITEGEKIQYEWNARNQITLWGPRGEILDYAVKQWSGVTADYFKPRWEIFIQQLQNALDFGMTFNQTAYIQTVFRVVEQPFTLSSKSYSEFPIGDSISIAGAIFEKWYPVYLRDSTSMSSNVRKLWRRPVKVVSNPTKKTKRPKKLVAV